METFTIDPRRWWMFRIFSRNPLLRSTDRIEMLVIVLAIAVSLAAAPIAGAVGSAVYGARHHFYAQEAQTRHAVTATVIDTSINDRTAIDSRASVERSSGSVGVQATWPDGKGLRTGLLQSDKPVKVGQPVKIWVDNSGTNVGPPTPASRAGADAFGIGWGIWFSVSLVAASLAALTLTRLQRTRDAQWEREIACLDAEA
jgi:hypothetical protein